METATHQALLHTRSLQMQMVLLAAGIPLEAIGILLVIDKPLDTFRTAVNVQGDIVGAVVTQNFVNRKSRNT